jgi:hypothetical protein
MTVLLDLMSQQIAAGAALLLRPKASTACLARAMSPLWPAVVMKMGAFGIGADAACTRADADRVAAMIAMARNG